MYKFRVSAKQSMSNLHRVLVISHSPGWNVSQSDIETEGVAQDLRHAKPTHSPSVNVRRDHTLAHVTVLLAMEHDTTSDHSWFVRHVCT